MRRADELAYRRHSRLLALPLSPELRDAVWTDRYRGRATTPPEAFSPAERTRFSAVRAAWDLSIGIGRRIGDVELMRRETHTAEAAFDQGGAGNPAARAVKLLHEIVPFAGDLSERHQIISEIEPVSAGEREVWTFISDAARILAGRESTTQRSGGTPLIIEADLEFGEVLEWAIQHCHPLAVLATVNTWVGRADKTRFRRTVEILHGCFGACDFDVDIWTADQRIWRNLFVDTTHLLELEVNAHLAIQRSIHLTPRQRHDVWLDEVRPLARVNAVLRRLVGLGAEIGDLLLLPREPEYRNANLRPDTDLFDSVALRKLMLLGLEVLQDPLEVWAWRNLWCRGCRPQACLPTIDELIPFESGTWRVLVPEAHSKTGRVVDYVLQPLANFLGWGPEACPGVQRMHVRQGGVDPTSVAEKACRRVRAAWATEQANRPDLPDLPDRLAYMTRKLLALWLAQRVSTEVMTRWLSHATKATNQPYVRPTATQVMSIRISQKDGR